MAFSLRLLLEGAVTVAAVILSTEFAFATFPMWTGYDQPLGFAVVPFLVFAGFRFGQQGGTVATLIAVLTALFVTVPAVGLVAEGTASQRLTYQSVFMIFVSTTTMLLTDLTQQLLAFARRQVVETRPLSIGTLTLNLEPFLRRLIGEHIELVIGTPPDLWPVKADRGQLEQVLVNLSVNARDAMPDGGRL